MVPPNMTIDNHRSSDDFLLERSSLWPEVKVVIGLSNFGMVWSRVMQHFVCLCLIRNFSAEIFLHALPLDKS